MAKEVRVRVAVIGTGVAGSLLTAAARRDQPSLDLKAFDKIVSGAREEAGTGLNIGPNALKALRRDGGIGLEALHAVSLPWRRWLIALTNGTRLVDLDIMEVAEEPGLRIRWADLYAVLRAVSASATRYDRALEAVEEDAHGRLIPVLRDRGGELHRHGAFDLLVAADGRYSRLRELVAGKPQARFPGIGTWRLLVRLRGDCPIDDYGQYFCGHARLLSFRLPNDYAYIAGSFPLEGDGPIPDDIRTVQAQRRFFLPQDGAPSAETAWILDQFALHPNDVNWARTQEIDTLHQAADGRVLLIGDAAHAMFQTLGQGATQAIEDALAAAAVLRTGPATPQALCSAYEARRSARITFAKDFTRDATDTLMPGADPVAGSLAKAQEPFLSKLRTLYMDVA
jgi:2-polyprenyl-6-methoxyphenol hydroxylase-like FAD-dependent oxidoreductase